MAVSRFITNQHNQTFHVLIDECDVVFYDSHKWYVAQKGGVTKRLYVLRLDDLTGLPRYLHRDLLNARPNQTIDHKNHNCLDNTRSNLRFCNQSTNGANRLKQSGTSSKFKGVYRHKQTGKWQARLQVNKQRIFLGNFDSETDAAQAYNQAAICYFGEYAYLNKVAI
jgi:hypothetical protein